MRDTFFFCGACRPIVIYDPLILEVFEITHNDTPQSVGLLWTSDQPFAETSTSQHTTTTTNIHTHRRDLNPQSQQASGRRPTPQTARPLRPADEGHIPYCIWSSCKLYFRQDQMIYFLLILSTERNICQSFECLRMIQQILLSLFNDLFGTEHKLNCYCATFEFSNNVLQDIPGGAKSKHFFK